MELKEILGEDLFNQVQEKLVGQGPQGKDIELVATNTGDYVPAKKYDSLKKDYEKVDTDYKTLNSNFESKINEINDSKDKDIKKILLNNKFESLNLMKVNNSYDYLVNSIDTDKIAVDGLNLNDNENVLDTFIKENPQLVRVNDDAHKQEQKETLQKPIPSATGFNPQDKQEQVKDRNYYVSLYKDSKDLTEKLAIKRMAGERGIILN